MVIAFISFRKSKEDPEIVEEIIRKWLKNEITLEEIEEIFGIGIDYFNRLLKKYHHVIEEIGFERGDKFINDTLEEIAREKYNEKILQKVEEKIGEYIRGEITLIETLRRSSKIGCKHEYTFAMISNRCGKSTNELMELLEKEQNREI